MHALSLVLDDDETVMCSPAVRAIVECQECSSVVIFCLNASMLCINNFYDCMYDP